jgi:16S rRNA (uracil1498-N3)-methyltransferase
MRSVFLDLNNLNDSILLEDKDKLHHLNNVVKVKKTEEILILNGAGLKAKYLVSDINKKQLHLKMIDEVINESRRYDLSILIGLTKKDDLSSIIKSSVEIGAREIIICLTEYSQRYKVNTERIDRIIVSAMEQSNNSIKPNLMFLESFESLNTSDYNHIIALDPYKEESLPNELREKVLLVIGPEGGFSRDEVEFLSKEQRTSFMKFNSPILRAKTAVSVGFGRLYSLMDC